MFLEYKSTWYLPKKQQRFRTWRRLKRSKSLKSWPILVWETRSSVARSAWIAASTAIVCELGFEKEWSAQQRCCPSSRPQCFQCSCNSPHASLLQNRAGFSLCICSPRAPLFPTRWILPWNSCATAPIHCDWRQNTVWDTYTAIMTNMLFEHPVRCILKTI